MKNLSLRLKLFLLSGFLLMVSMIIGGIGYRALVHVEGEYSEITDMNVPNLISMYEMLMQYRWARINVQALGLPGTTAAEAEVAMKNIVDAMEVYEKQKAEYLSRPFGVGEEEIFRRVEKGIDKAEKDFMAASELYRNSTEGSLDRLKLVKFLNEVIAKDGDQIRAAGRDLREYHQKAAKESEVAAGDAFDNGVLLSIISLVVGGTLGMLFAFLFSNTLVRTLTNISESISEASSQVAAGSTQIASSSEELSQATTEQASSLEETAASIEEMTSMVNKNTENAKNASTVSQESYDSANKGKEAVEQMIVSMDEINKSNEQITEIVKVINEIGNKTKVINDIVFQTKLLSFNASVEAARAGEHGKGFAVVAEEVGNLAQMSGNAAKEISSLLENSIHKVEAIVHETKGKVESGTLTARQCGEVLAEIVKNVSEVSKMAGEISTASDEQSRGVQEISKAMNQLDQVTQTNAATSEEAASAAEELSAQADSLKSLVIELQKTIHGQSGEVIADAPKKKFVKPNATAGKVVHLKSSHKTQEFKKVAGDDTLPSYDDPRFKDV